MKVEITVFPDFTDVFRRFNPFAEIFVLISGFMVGMVYLHRQGYAAAGRQAEARKTLADLKERGQQTYVQPIALGMIHALLGEKDQAFDWLQRALDDRSTGLIYLKVDPAWDGIRGDSRFQELQARVGLK